MWDVVRSHVIFHLKKWKRQLGTFGFYWSKTFETNSEMFRNEHISCLEKESQQEHVKWIKMNMCVFSIPWLSPVLHSQHPNCYSAVAAAASNSAWWMEVSCSRCSVLLLAVPLVPRDDTPLFSPTPGGFSPGKMSTITFRREGKTSRYLLKATCRFSSWIKHNVIFLEMLTIYCPDSARKKWSLKRVST